MTRRTRTAILAAGAVLIIGAAVILAVVLSSRDDGQGEDDTTAASHALSSDERDAAWACSVLSDLPDPFDMKAMDITAPPLHRAIAAGAFAWAAADASDQWADFQEPGKDLIAGAATLDADQFSGAIADLQEQCENVPAVSFEGDIELSCQVVDLLPEDIEAEFEDDPLSSPTVWELMAIGSLGRAADYADKGTPDDVAEAASDLVKAANALDSTLAVAGVSVFREYCAGRD